MRCPIETQESAETLVAYCAGRLDPASEAPLERHLPACPACRAFIAAQRTVWHALDSWEPTPVDPGFDRRLYRRIEDDARAPWWLRAVRPFGPTLVSRGLAVAAAACLLIFAGIIMETPSRQEAPGNTGARVESVRPDQVERTLEDMELLADFNREVRTQTQQSKAM